MNPWAGLASYEDPQNAEYDLKFCGRDDDSYDVARLIMGNVFVTLYGKSGIGKTSLLNAGVFPELREDGFTPISVRLGIRDEKNPKSFQRIIIDAVEQVIKNCDVIEVVPEQCDQTSKDFLWNYFARHRFCDTNKKQTIPVIVLDQFEEVFRKDRDEAEILLRQIDYLNDRDHALDACEVNGLAYRYEQNFRFTVSIREDDLYRMEDSLDNCYLPALKRSRYRLRSLSEEDAQKVILIPGEGLFRPEEQDDIVKRVIEATRQKGDDSISTNLLSLICNRLYNDCKNAGSEYISGSFVESFMKGNPIERFYNEATNGFSDKEKEYIETHLVDSNGRRNSISESDFKKHVPEGQKLLEGGSRILQRTSTSSDGASYRIELIHDSFCDPISTQKEMRDKRKRSKQLIFLWIVLALCISIIVFVTFIIYDTKRANWEMMYNRAHIVAVKGKRLIDEHDSYLARLLALEILPKSIKKQDKLYVPQAEELLRKAYETNDFIVRTDWPVDAISFSHDSKKLTTLTETGSLRIWGTEAGEFIDGYSLSQYDAGKMVSFTENDNSIYFTSDSGLNLLDLETDHITHCLRTTGGQLHSVFTVNNKDYLLALGDNVNIIDLETHELTEYKREKPYMILDAAVTLDGKTIASAEADGIMLWDLTNPTHPKTIDAHNGARVLSVAFSSDGQLIASASVDSTIRVWSVSSHKQVIPTLKGHSGYVRSVAFSPDGRCIASASNDSTIRLWNTKTGTLIWTRKFKYKIGSVVFSPNSQKIAYIPDKFDGVGVCDTVLNNSRNDFLSMSNSVYKDEITSFSPNGRFVLSTVYNSYYDRDLFLYDFKINQQFTDKLEGKTFISCAWSKDEKYIAIVFDNNRFGVWNLETHQQIGTLASHEGCSSVAFSPNTDYVVSASEQGTAYIWSLKTMQHVCALPKFNAYFKSKVNVAFSPDGKKIAINSRSPYYDEANIYIYTMTRNYSRCEGVDSMNIPKLSSSISFSPDSKRIASVYAPIAGKHSLLMWDVKTKDIVYKPIDPYNDRINSFAFSSDGRYVASVSDNVIQIRDILAGELVCPPILADSCDFKSVCFSSEDKLMIGTSQGNIRIIDFPPLQKLIDQTRKQFKNRKINPFEKTLIYRY